jgi:uncharacterized protein (DUF302 family)
MTTALGMEVRLAGSFGEALMRTRKALQAEGFGVLSEIDMEAAFREKLNRPFRPYVILGACNPPLAHRALSADPEVGLLLPCNVTVEALETGGAVVRLVDPERLLAAAAPAGSAELGLVARDAGERLRRVAASLAQPPETPGPRP